MDLALGKTLGEENFSAHSWDKMQTKPIGLFKTDW